MKISINSHTTGKFRTAKLNGRDHIVTDMVSIVGDSVMNRGLYPDEEVGKTFNQLDSLPAPNGHPNVNGRNISAFHPLAVNAHNIGGIIRNPTKDGKVVKNELWLDIEVANGIKDGIELIRRINGGENVGVSTGLNLTQDMTNGKTDDGSEFDWIGKDFHFDHVAILLNEDAAGKHVGTELKVNEDELQIVSVENELGVNSLKKQLRSLLEDEHGQMNFVFIVDCFTESKTVIFGLDPRNGGGTTIFEQGYEVDRLEIVSLTGTKREVVRKVEFVPVSGNTAENTENGTMGDKSKAKAGEKPAEATNDSDQAGEVTNNSELTVESAIKFLENKGMSVKAANADGDEDLLEFVKNNRPAIEKLLSKDAGRLDDIRKDIVANSEMTEDDVKSIADETVLVNLQKSLVREAVNTLRAGGDRSASNGEKSEVKENLGTPNYDGDKKKEAA